MADLPIASGPLREVIEALWAGKTPARLSGLPGSSAAFLGALAAHELMRPVMLILPEEKEAGRVAKEAEFYLAALGAKASARHLPRREPYRGLPGASPGARTAALAAMVAAGLSAPAVVVSSWEAALTVTAPPDVLADFTGEVRLDAALERDALAARLIGSGYTAVSAVMEPGDFSVRGGIVDVFAPGAEAPVRIELWEETVKSLRAFDPETQKSKGDLGQALIPPLKEAVMSGDGVARAAHRLRKQAEAWKEDPGFAYDRSAMAKAAADIIGRVERRDHFPGIESFVSAFYPERACALDYLSPSWIVIFLDEFSAQEELHRRLEALEEEWRGEINEGFALPPFDHLADAGRGLGLVLKTSSIWAGLTGERQGLGVPAASIQGVIAGIDDLKVRPEEEDPLFGFFQTMQDLIGIGVRVSLISAFTGKAVRFQELLAARGLDFPVIEKAAGSFAASKAAILVGPLQRGFIDLAGKLAVVPESEVFGEKIRPQPRPRTFASLISDLADLEEGDYVVHVDHGIGIYRGLVSLTVQWVGEWDFVNQRERPRIRVDAARLEYANQASLYLPVHRLNLISKYRGADEAPPALDVLGGTGWEKLKRKVKESVREFAEYLIKIHAARKVHRGVAFPSPDREFHEFEETFPYEETPDQLQAIEDVLGDMRDEKPMDRIVCGDVGYGKTEVALRAAFLAAMSGRQVAILAPTTILAQQHYETFRKRLARYPLVVKVLSRFRTARDQKETAALCARGGVDIVIGTHRLLSKDVSFKNLGLLVIDEEHRFGVKHKEKIRAMKATVDTLTLTATPIPRTLHMAVSGFTDLSIINTPPPDRLAVFTDLVRFDERLIREAIERELRREGQVFYVHNRVQTIDAALHLVHSLVPQARAVAAHGQMKEDELEKIMGEFIARKHDVLVCTAIIESGLDIPTVNTMIIDRADQFGLAQLYQLRGRVGRGRERAYCYLVVPSKGVMTKDALKRLKVLKEFSELGSGFRIAAHDLEIRGAGNLLGSEQSGHISRIGMELYTQLLDEEVRKLREEPVEIEIDPEIKLPIPAYLDDGYVPDANQRLAWYKRLSQAHTIEEVEDLREELIDRYGRPPEAAENLLEIGRLKTGLKKLRVLELAYNGTELILRLDDQNQADVDKVIALATKSPRAWRVSPEGHVFRRFAAKTPSDLFPAIRELLNEVSGRGKIFN